MSIKLFSASAGSGKTFTLTLEYIKLALREEDRRGYFRKILAVTFTIKAADEMRSRIIEFLQGISDPKSDHDEMLLNLIFEDFNQQGLNLNKSEISKRASNALQQILQDYGLFSVMTIDSFVQRLSTTFIEELNLPSQFEVILDSNALMDQLIDQLLEKVNRLGDPVLTDLLIDFAKTEVSEGRSWNLLRANLHQFLRICLDESYFQIKPHMDVFSMADFRRIEDQIRQQVNFVEDQLYDIADEFIRYVNPLQLSDDSFTGGKFSPVHYFRKYLGSKKIEDFKFSSLHKSIDLNQWAASKVDKSTAAQINDLASSFSELGSSFVALYDANYSRNQILLWIARDIKKIALLASISEELFDYQNEYAAVSISEFSKRLYQVIANDPVPFIYEKLGDRYTHILIDEFQDTSMLQWQNFMPLLENAVSLGHQNLLVGDAKQSIYKFRGGEVGLIASLTNQDKQIIQSKLNEGSFDEERYDYLLEFIVNQNLAYNYRSAAEIVSFNNSFFTWIAEQEIYTSLSDLIKPIYGQFLTQIPNVKADKFTGHVDLSVFKKPKLDSETQDLEQIWMLAQVIGLIEDNLRLGFTYADMAILTRKNKHARLLAIQLKEKGIPIISSDSLLIHYSILVGVIVGFLKLKANPENEFLAYELIFQIQEITGFKKEIDLVNDFKIHAKSSVTLLGNVLSYLNWPSNLKSFQELSLIQTIYAIIERFDLLNQTEGTEYLFKFLDVVQDFSVTKSDDIAEFLTYYELNKHTITIASPEGINAVTITSIHKSKGLEYGVVIVPFANWTHQANLERIWYDLPVSSFPELTLDNHALRHTFGRVAAKEISGETFLKGQSVTEKHSIFLDALNMMYVAFTRAKQRLHILTTIPSEESSDPTKRAYRASFAEVLINYAQNHAQPEEDLPAYTPVEYQLLTDYYILTSNIDAKHVAKKSSTNVDRSISIASQVIPSPAFRIRSESADIYTQSKAKRTQGEYLHDVLAQITGNHFWFANRNTRFAHLEEPIRQLVDQIMHDIELSQWFVDEELIFSERDILTPSGDVYRPDRVVSKAGKCVIIDFKTGKRREEHLDQIKLYKQLLGQLGQEVGSGVLLYLDDLSTVYV
jgi:ATP-dependent exoDNAse (exonuclease V) beta subunit